MFMLLLDAGAEVLKYVDLCLVDEGKNNVRH